MEITINIPSEIANDELEVLFKKILEERREPKTFGELVRNRPFFTPCFPNRDAREEPVYIFENPHFHNDDAWKLFVSLGKLLHQATDKYRIRGLRGAHMDCYHYPDNITHHKPPRTISELTTEEKTISANMMEEMIDIWNRYMVQVHPCAICNYEDGKGFIEVPAKNPLEK